MVYSIFLRAAGLAATLAGIARIIASFAPPSARWLYFTVDVLLFLGIMGLYGVQRKETGRWGQLGFLLALSGAVLLVEHDVVQASANLYSIAALLFAVGITILALASWSAHKLPRWALALFITATLVGIPGYFLKTLGVLFIVSGVLFGLGCIGAGTQVLVQPVKDA